MLLFVLLPWVALGEILSGVSSGKEEVQSLSSSLFSSVFDDLLDPTVPLEVVDDDLPPLIVRPANVFRPLRIRRSAKPRQVAYGNENKISSSPVPPSPQSTVSSSDTVNGAPSATPFDPQFRKAALASGLTVGVTSSEQMETEEKTSPQRLVLSELEDHVPSTTTSSTPTTVSHSAPSHSPTLSRPSAMSRVAEEEISEEEEEEERERPAPTRAPAPTTTTRAPAPTSTTHSTTITSTSASTTASTTVSAPTTSPASASASDLFFSAPTSHSSSSSDASQSSTLSHSSSSSDASQSSTLSHSSSSSDASQSSTLSHSSSSSGAAFSSTISNPSTSDVSPSSSISHSSSDVSSPSTFSRTSSSHLPDLSSEDSVPSSSATSSFSSVSHPSSSSSFSSSSSGSHNSGRTNQRPAHHVYQPSSSSTSHPASLPHPISLIHSNRRPTPSTTFRRPTHEPTGPTIVGGNSINYNGGGGFSQNHRPAPISRPAYSSHRNNGARGSTYVLRPSYTGYSAPRPLFSGYARMQPVYHSARYSQPRFSYSPSYSVYSAPSQFVPYPQQGYNNGGLVMGTPTFSQYAPYGPISQPTTYWFTQPSGQTYQPAYTNAVPSYQSAQSYSPYGNTYKVGGGRYAYLG